KEDDSKALVVKWTDEDLKRIENNLDALAKNNMYAWIYLYDLGNVKPDAPSREETLRKVVGRLKDHAANGGWKGADEPAWGKIPPGNILHAYRIIHEVDADHPVLVLHAPKGEW